MSDKDKAALIAALNDIGVEIAQWIKATIDNFTTEIITTK